MELLYNNLYLDSLSSNSSSYPPEPEEQAETGSSRAPTSTVHHHHHRHESSGGERHGAEVLKVSTKSRPSAVAGAIAGVIRENGHAEVQSIGAGATNQAIKAVAIARSYLQEEGVDIVCIPSFIDVSIDEEERTAIRLLIEKRQPKVS
jgi:stage V sporulation protein S